MDTKEKSLHLLGTFGIVGEVFKIIHSQAKVLGIITLVSILPPILITLTNIWIAPYVLREMIFHKESDVSLGLYILNWTEFVVVEVVWITFFYMGLMPSIAAVVYSVAGVYKGEQGISVYSLPAVWKRMLITCMWHFLASLLIVVGFGFVMMLSIWMPLGIPFLISLVVFGCLGTYVAMVWHMATMVSVMEEYYGLAGLKRSRRLIHGKRITACGLLMFLIVFVGLFNSAAIMGNYYSVSFWANLLYIIGYVVLASVITLMWEVTQSVFYFVCKAHHGDSVDEGLSLEALPERPPIASAGGNGNLEINNNTMGRPNFLTS